MSARCPVGSPRFAPPARGQIRKTRADAPRTKNGIRPGAARQTAARPRSERRRPVQGEGSDRTIAAVIRPPVLTFGPQAVVAPEPLLGPRQQRLVRQRFENPRQASEIGQLQEKNVSLPRGLCSVAGADNATRDDSARFFARRDRLPQGAPGRLALGGICENGGLGAANCSCLNRSDFAFLKVVRV